MGFFSFLNRNKNKYVAQPPVAPPELLLFGLNTYPQYSEWDGKRAIEEGLKASSIFYACVGRRAEALSEVKWVAKRKKPGGEMVEEPNSPLQKLLDNPNPDFSLNELMELCSYHLDLMGNSYWRLIRAGNEGRPVEFWPLIPYGMKIKPGKTRLVESYHYSYNGVNQEYLANDIVQLKTINPDNFLFGMPPLQAAGRAVDIDRESCDWQKVSLQNRGVPDLAIIMDPNSTPDQVERVKALMKDNMAGPKNARKPIITNKDVKMLGHTAVEMDFSKSRTKVWEEICAVMGVPLPLVGVLENATLANIETCRKIFWLDTMIPQLRRVKSQLDYQLAREFGPDWHVEYVLSDVQALAEDFGEKLDNAAKLLALGVPLAEINEKLGLGLSEEAVKNLSTKKEEEAANGS